jgi:DNA polymerase III alpha subunit
MNYDQFGQRHLTEQNLFSLLYDQPDLDLGNFLIDNPQLYNKSVDETHVNFPKLQQYVVSDISLTEFDQLNQEKWFMPDEYKSIDIAKHILELCKSDEDLQRVGQELLLFQEKKMFPLLCYLKYLVDTMRKNNIVWGVGRGSSVASYVLYLLGVHKINSLYYDLPIEEFLKD